MKRLGLILIMLLITTLSFAQGTHVLKLKNGSSVRGTVLELLPTESIKIQTADGKTQVYSITEIEDLRLAYEPGRQNQNTNVNSGIRYLMRDGDRFYWYDSGKELTNKDLRQIITPDLYNTYQSARKQFNTGNSFLALGLVGVVSGLSFYLIDHASREEGDALEVNSISLGLLSGSQLFLGLGFLFHEIGKGRLNWVQDTYNASSSQAQSSFSISPSIMLTSQNNFGLGATISFTF